MNITIIGGGNIGTLTAAECSQKGHNVTIYTPCSDGWNKEIKVYGRENEFLFKAPLANVTNDLEKAVANADYILITYPAELFDNFAQKLLPFISIGQCIGMLPGIGGAEFAFRNILNKGVTFFGLQRVPSVARLKERGKSVNMLGKRDKLYLASIPQNKSKELSKITSDWFEIPCDTLPNYLSVTLTPSNPILHTTRLYAMFKDYKGQTYPKNYLFYKEWDNTSSDMLIKCDEEVQNLCRIIPLDLSGVKSLRLHYENDTVEGITKKISTIPSLKKLTSPMKKKGSGWIPDFTSRYFSTDFPYGLKIILDICHLFEVPAPNLEKIWTWYISVSPQKSFEMNLSKEEFMNLYS